MIIEETESKVTILRTPNTEAHLLTNNLSDRNLLFYFFVSFSLFSFSSHTMNTVNLTQSFFLFRFSPSFFYALLDERFLRLSTDTLNYLTLDNRNWCHRRWRKAAYWRITKTPSNETNATNTSSYVRIDGRRSESRVQITEFEISNGENN